MAMKTDHDHDEQRPDLAEVEGEAPDAHAGDEQRAKPESRAIEQEACAEENAVRGAIAGPARGVRESHRPRDAGTARQGDLESAEILLAQHAGGGRQEATRKVHLQSADGGARGLQRPRTREQSANRAHVDANARHPEQWAEDGEVQKHGRDGDRKPLVIGWKVDSPEDPKRDERGLSRRVGLAGSAQQRPCPAGSRRMLPIGTRRVRRRTRETGARSGTRSRRKDMRRARPADRATARCRSRLDARERSASARAPAPAQFGPRSARRAASWSSSPPSRRCR